MVLCLDKIKLIFSHMRIFLINQNITSRATQITLKLLKGHYFYRMATTLSFIFILALTRDLRVVCDGQFFEITKDDMTMEAGKPFLTSDVFECSGQNTCKTYTRSTKSSGNADPSNVVFSMRKTKGLSTTILCCLWLFIN